MAHDDDHMQRAQTSHAPCRQAGPGDSFPLKIVDAALAGCIFLVPFLMGGRTALGQFALVLLAVVAAAAWLVHQALGGRPFWRRCGVEWLLLGGVVLVGVQLVPLPDAVLHRLAPHTQKVLPLWTSGDGGAGLGRWSTVSFTPAATTAGLVIYLAYGLLFLVTVQRISRVADVERLIRWFAVSAVAMAVFGLLQYLMSNQRFFWFYEVPYAQTSDLVKGAFTNRNHFAQFLALGIGPVLWWIQNEMRSRRSSRSPTFSQSTREVPSFELGVGLRVLGLGIVLLAALLSLSRGGAMAMAVALGICLLVFWRARIVALRFVAAVAVVAGVITMALFIHGYERVANRLDDFGSGSVEELDREGGRRAIWAAVLDAIPDYAPVGSGVGSHREVYQMYLSASDERIYTHAENGYLQVALETGPVGLVLVALGIAAIAYWCVGAVRAGGSQRITLCAAALAAGLAANVVHSAVDFVWYVPGCMVLVAIAAGAICRLRQLAGPERIQRPVAVPVSAPVAWTAAILVLAIGAWMTAGRFGPVVAEAHWNRYLLMKQADAKLALAREKELEAEEAAQEASEPEGAERVGDRQLDQPPEATGSRPAGSTGPSVENIEGYIAELEEAVRWDPDNAKAHMDLAGAYLGYFDAVQMHSPDRFPLSQLRETYLDVVGQCGREEADRWFNNAFRDKRQHLDKALAHTRRGLQLCPLDGRGYLYLAELSFLDGGDVEAKRQLVQQAYRVRPYDGDVLFRMGQEAILEALAGDGSQAAGTDVTALFQHDLKKGLDFWKRSWQRGRPHQQKIVDQLAAAVPHPDWVRLLIGFFEPDLAALKMFAFRYEKLGWKEHLDLIQWYRARAAVAEARKQRGQEAAETWLEAEAIFSQYERWPDAIRCAEQAVACDPNSYRAHARLGRGLMSAERYAEAEEHYRWCLHQRPGNSALGRILDRIAEKRHEQFRQQRSVTSRAVPYLQR